MVWLVIVAGLIKNNCICFSHCKLKAKSRGIEYISMCTLSEALLLGVCGKACTETMLYVLCKRYLF